MMSTEYSGDLVAKNNYQPRAVGKNWTTRDKCRDKKKEIDWIGHTLRKSENEISYSALFRMEPTRTEITGRRTVLKKWEEIIWRI
jgi:hypothetical protein